MGVKARDPLDRFWEKVDKTETCWIWTAHINWKGYGQFYFADSRGNKRMMGAHRAAYELFVDEIPSGLIIDHLCRVRHCVNPEHMELVTNQENLDRGDTNSKRTHCPRDHEYTPENTYMTSKGSRVCRACMKLHRRERTLAINPNARTHNYPATRPGRLKESVQ